ncbi:MAG: Smr/MutS family protein [Rhizomicrobium sp.]|nr:Smr/MutS family protein [Rhizomicrobium sp.]
MRRITAEERALFLAALSGRLPAKKAKPAAESVKLAKSAAQAMPPTAEQSAQAADKRRVTAEEFDLFLDAIGMRKHSAPTPVARIVAPPPKMRAVKHNPAGLDGNTKKRLEKGDIHPSAKLDLHGMTEAAAHGALLTFLHTAYRRGDRLVLIVTGKGALEAEQPKAMAKERYRGVLRRSVPRWLEEAPMASIIADKRWAHRRHGGDGALYIYLRKSA